MDNAIKLVLLIAKGMLENKKREIEDFLSQQKIDWEKFLRLLQFHELLPIAFIFLKENENLIPSGIYKSLESGYFFGLAKNILLWEQFLSIAKAFNVYNIDFVPLKGFSFIGEIYPDINYRLMADIDILVKEETLAQVEDILLNLGYEKHLSGLTEKYWREKQCHIAFLKRLSSSQNILVEVHWDLDFKRLNRMILPQIWERIEERDIEGNKIKFLSIEDTIFSLALHKRRFGNILALKEVCDLACLLKKFISQIDWDYILKWAFFSKINATLYFSLFQIRLIDSNLVSHSLLQKLKLPYWKRKAINNLIIKNTFSINEDIKKNYLKAHFLLYDSIWEPIKYIINIPQEQFAKFYGLIPYSEKANLLYRMRFLYFPIGLLKRRKHA